MPRARAEKSATPQRKPPRSFSYRTSKTGSCSAAAVEMFPRLLRVDGSRSTCGVGSSMIS